MKEFKKTGYLNNDFKIFHLIDQGMAPVNFHFHEFHKILILLKGNVSYCIEGRSYDLQPDDVVFVPAGEVHCPVVHDQNTYERIIIYISKGYLDGYRTDSYDLSQCLSEAHQKQSHVLRIPSFTTSKLGQIVRELEHSLDSKEYANELYHNLLFLEFMVQLNRNALRNSIEYLSNTSSNQKMIAIIDYLNEHLTEDISIDSLSEIIFPPNACFSPGISFFRENRLPTSATNVDFVIIPLFLALSRKISDILPGNNVQSIRRFANSEASYRFLYSFSASVLIRFGINCFFLETTPFNIIPFSLDSQLNALAARCALSAPRYTKNVDSFNISVSMIKII